MRLLVVAFSMLLWWTVACDTTKLPDITNPLDPEDPDYEPPTTTITNAPTDTITTTTTVISWHGNHAQSEFTYRLDNIPFSSWSTDTSIALDYLDEGDHLFEVKSRHPTGQEEKVALQVHFHVNAVPSQSIVLFPFYKKVSPGDTLTIELHAEDVSGLTVLDCRFEYDTTAIKPVNATGGPFLAKDGGDLIFINEFDPQWHINMGVAQGPTAGVDGSGILATLRFRVHTNHTTTIGLLEVDARGPNDEKVSITMVRGSQIEAEE